MSEQINYKLSFAESRIKGSLIRERLLSENVDYISRLEQMAEHAGSYQLLLSGESEISKPPEGQGAIKDKYVLSKMDLLDKSYLTFGSALKGPDYRDLELNHPNERFKFYSSMDLTTPEKVAVAEEWFGEVAKEAHDLGISLTTKSFDHAYDSLNLYTWHPNELEEIIKKLYPKYLEKGMYNKTPHFFQKPIDGVDPDHIGCVQEPEIQSGIGPGMSHSARMGRLGQYLDKALSHGGELSKEVWIDASEFAGINSEQPYLIQKS